MSKTLKKSSVNQGFRAWTRGTSFTLNMGKTQVITLIAIDISRNKYVGLLHPLLRCFVVAMRGLEDRGLVHRPKSWTEDKWRESIGKPTPIIAAFEPTEAGQHVIELFKCSGIYSELKQEILSYDFDEYGYYSIMKKG